MTNIGYISARFIVVIGFCQLFCGLSLAGDDIYQQKYLQNCGQYYYGEKNPRFVESTKNSGLYYLCFDGFAVGYSEIGKVARWSAEYLDKQRIDQANLLEREDNFHEESQLPNRIKATLSDYQKTPYDRGHLSPNGDMATQSQQYDSFSLANIVPQNPKHNRGIWRNLESRTRYLAVKYGEIYVVTGTAFIGDSIKMLNQRVAVPTHLYKAIYIPSIHQAGVYYTPNNDSGYVEVISLEELAIRTGIDVMPMLDSKVQKIAMPLPVDNFEPTVAKNSQKNADNPDVVKFLANLLLKIFQWLLQLLKN